MTLTCRIALLGQGLCALRFVQVSLQAAKLAVELAAALISLDPLGAVGLESGQFAFPLGQVTLQIGHLGSRGLE